MDSREPLWQKTNISFYKTAWDADNIHVEGVAF